jgi:hypothetical protein
MVLGIIGSPQLLKRLEIIGEAFIFQFILRILTLSTTTNQLFRGTIKEKNPESSLWQST